MTPPNTDHDTDKPGFLAVDINTPPATPELMSWHRSVKFEAAEEPPATERQAKRCVIEEAVKSNTLCAEYQSPALW